MNDSLSYALVTPRAVAKGRAGGALARLLSRTDLDLVGARMVAADGAFAAKYAGALRGRAPEGESALLASYVERNLALGGELQGMLLLFSGENPCEKLLDACGEVCAGLGGRTIRDTFGEIAFPPGGGGEPSHFEPAVIFPRSQKDADADLLMFAGFLEGKENLGPDPAGAERALVILKPDNWERNSTRPGAIIDIFSRTGLRIAAAKIHRMSLAEALEFYGPVEAALREKLAGKFGRRARELLEKEFGFAMGEGAAGAVEEAFGAECAANEFSRIVEFMSGRRPGHPRPDEPGDAKSMVLVYEGEGAVEKIRCALGPTNPADAPDGTVRREHGATIMVNAAHASDSAESYRRERGVLKLDENSLGATIRERLGRG